MKNKTVDYLGALTYFELKREKRRKIVSGIFKIWILSILYLAIGLLLLLEYGGGNLYE